MNGLRPPRESPILMRRMRTAIVVLFTVGACGTSMPPPLGDTDASTVVTIVKTGACSTEGETITCQVVTGETSGVVDCFHGVQTCTGGLWSVCGYPSDGSSALQDASDASSNDDASDADTADADTTDVVNE
jgi:hypothetical protein